jgi:hypothetical protein
MTLDDHMSSRSTSGPSRNLLSQQYPSRAADAPGRSGGQRGAFGLFVRASWHRDIVGEPPEHTHHLRFGLEGCPDQLEARPWSHIPPGSAPQSARGLSRSPSCDARDASLMNLQCPSCERKRRRFVGNGIAGRHRPAPLRVDAATESAVASDTRILMDATSARAEASRLKAS